jgi:hypothetical protein
MIIRKSRDGVRNWAVWHKDLTANYALEGLNTTGAEISGGSPSKYFRDVNSTTFSVGDDVSVNASGESYIAYCFHDVANYSKFGSYTGNGSATGPVVTLGFSPAFVMIKRTDTGGNGWVMLDNTRNPFGNFDNHLEANTSAAETDNTGDGVMPSSTGFQLTNTYAGMNASGGTYIYAAFADTREYAYWYDQSGNNNDWTSEGGLTESDVMVDSPTNNFATLNVVDLRGTVTVSEGNLKASLAVNGNITGTIAPSSGKWYWEFYLDDISNPYIGLQSVNTAGSGSSGYSQDAVALNNAGDIFYDGGNQGGAFEGSPAWTIGDVLGVAYNIDSDKMWWSLNGQWYSANAASQSAINVSEVLAGTSAYDLSSQITQGIPFLGSSASNGIVTTNFGQDSSFAGNKTPQGNQDSNGIGDFFYAPPTGFLALCTSNLPSVDVIPSEHFNTVLYTGNGSTQSITGVGLKPDFVWWKSRNGSNSNVQNDSVRGVELMLRSNLTNAESTGDLTSFDSDGFSVRNTVDNGNYNGETYVAWNWKAGGTAVSNTNGSITSSVSANVDAGFSIASFTTLAGTVGTVGHGLTLAVPELVILKTRSSGAAWNVWHTDILATQRLRLDGTDAVATSDVFGNTSPTSTVFTQEISSTVQTAIAYCFHSVDGYSKVGSYTGNGSTDGPFVHCGFRPAYVMIKQSSGTGSWVLLDTTRSAFNVINNASLWANDSSGEGGSASYFDMLSNGFKIRDTDSDKNDSGQTYIFLAFAEMPFKHTNAR